MFSNFFSSPDLAAAAAIVVFAAILFLRSWRNLRALPELPTVHSDATPDCMVVIPARNEEACIARAVKSFPPDTVIVVDDHSTDRTPEEARKSGAGVVLAPELPRKAVGKAHACLVGARLLTSRWVLFADADTWYEASFLASAVAHAEGRGLDLLSLHLTPVTESPMEHLLTPYLSALFFSGASPRSELAAVFSGRCLLVRREPYEFIGGHAPVLESLTEDVKLAALAQRHRLRIAVARAGKSGYVRLYSGGRGIWAGIERDALRVAQVSHGIGAIILLTAIFAALSIPALVWLWIEGQRLVAGVLLAGLLVLMRPWFGIERVSMAPVAIYASIPFVLHGLIGSLSGRKIVWKGRVI